MAKTLKTKITIFMICAVLVRLMLEYLPVVVMNDSLEDGKRVVTISMGNTTGELSSSRNDDHYCSITSDWHTRLSLSHAAAYDDWTFTTTVDCPELNIVETAEETKWIQILSLSCSDGVRRMVPSWTNTSRGIASVEFGDPCLGEYIRTCCSDGKPVPNVVHYVWYNDKELDFFDFVSFISVIKFARPCLVLIHGEYVPRGKYWDYVIERSPNIIHVRRSRPETIFGQQIKFHENSGDIMRIEALLKYGGIYLDTDTILVRSIDNLRQYECTMSRQRAAEYLGSAFIMAKEESTFMQYWYNGYRDDFRYDQFWYNAMAVPYQLSINFSHLINVENYTMSRPRDYKGFKVFINNYNWSDLYGIHVYKRLYKKERAEQYNLTLPMSETTIRSLNSTVGSMFRYIIYGIKEVCNS